MRKKYILQCFWHYSIVLFLSCKNQDTLLEKALKRSGENRAELQHVIDHYSKNAEDSLKRKAAVFLISNMEGKFSYQGTEYRSFLDFLDSLSLSTTGIPKFRLAITDLFKNRGTLVGKPEKIFDLISLNSKFLINNIDSAFLIYNSQTIKHKLSFENFCEFILPYRIGNEPIESFRSKLYDQYKSVLTCGASSIRAVADSVLARTSPTGMTINPPFPDFVPDFPLSSLQKLKGGTCRESSNLAIYIMRALGIPVAADFTPQWPHRGFGHSWSALLLNDDSCIDFEGATSSFVGGHLHALKSFRIAKAYRHTFSKQMNSLAMIHGDEEIPDFFRDSCFKDVSSSYFKGTNIVFNIPKEISGNKSFAYICVFDNRNWIPIHWGKIEEGKVVFSNMGGPSIYVIALFDSGNIQPVGNPIMLDSAGNIKEILPHIHEKNTLSLKRKYPVFDWWNTRLQALKGGKFEAANKLDFSDGVIVYRIEGIPEMTYQTVHININRKYRYLRYIAPDSSYGSMAEIEFYGGDDQQLLGTVIGSDSTKSTGNGKNNVFDGDPLSYYDGDYPNDNWYGLDFRKPVQINKIRYLSRNDDNFIRMGDQYELVYWYKGSWQSLGIKVGTDSQIITYDNVPPDGVYLLRDNTRGKEERIFTYNNGKQIWW